MSWQQRSRHGAKKAHLKLFLRRAEGRDSFTHTLTLMICAASTGMWKEDMTEQWSACVRREVTELMMDLKGFFMHTREKMWVEYKKLKDIFCNR